MDNNEIKEFIKRYWDFYLALEEDFYSTSRYVDFSEKNNKTFSNEYLRLYLSICSEIDVFGKIFAKKINPDFVKNEDGQEKKYVTISDWGKAIQHIEIDGTNIYEQEVDFKGIGLIKPWKDLKIDNNNLTAPYWWNNYNEIKHNRTGIENGEMNYEKANFGNLCMAISGLFVLEDSYLKKYVCNEDLERIAKSKLFHKETRPSFYVENDTFVFGEKENW